MSLQVGETAPDFTLPDQSGAPVTLSEKLADRVVVLYFYPKDNTRGCTAEACSFRDNYECFSDAGAEVIGISSDSVESHEKFAGRHELPFILLSDKDRAVRKQYGATTLGVVPGRITFVIDRDGVIRHTFSSMANIGPHVEEALRVVRELTAA
ncbi:peroxiredoxin [Actinacidiphila acidipaludis]|uniref:thioredoxin-dependent peroxiredoxin n=1 Tax=Actinacidiphila acidipaludis TaxID=2873382 RepID=A0ABS7Q4M8_9ACTN|nr:peroxiredoxin [Streptomyces acidipaludis]MBY8878105.1 peroxiredoxin [Streptomyces acidipaludis]